MRNATMFKTTTSFPGRKLAARVAHHETQAEAERAACYWPNSETTIEQVEVRIFEIGDQVAVELHRGSGENDDGIRSGGQWMQARGVVREVMGNGAFQNCMLCDANGRHIQVMSTIAGVNGYPYRNAQLVAA